MKAVHLIRSGVLSVNTWIFQITEKKVFVVDPAACSFSGDENKITDYLKEKKLECMAIILTHAHFDHITGVDRIKAAFPKAKIVIHQQDAEEYNSKPGKMNTSVLQFFGMPELLQTVANQPEADIIVKDGYTLDKIFEDNIQIEESVIQALKKWKVLLTPGHTPGSICLYNSEDALLISGDTLFEGTYGRTDMYGGNEADMQKSLKLLSKLIPSGIHVFPGHDRDFII